MAYLQHAAGERLITRALPTGRARCSRAPAAAARIRAESVAE